MKKYWPLIAIAALFLLIITGSVYCFELAPQRKGITEVVGCFLIFSSAFVLSGFFVSALFCHYRVRRRNAIWHRLICVAACIATLVTMVLGCLIVDGSEALSIRYWFAPRMLIFWPLGLAVATPVSFALASYYRAGGT